MRDTWETYGNARIKGRVAGNRDLGGAHEVPVEIVTEAFRPSLGCLRNGSRQGIT